MTQIRTATKLQFARVLTTLVAMGVAAAPLALAAGSSSDTQSTENVVAVTNTLSVTTGESMNLTPTVGSPAVDASTQLTFDTNDGTPYKITVVAGTWVFAPAVVAAVTTKYPVLRFVSADSSAGTESTTAGVLIDEDNGAMTEVDVVTAITSASGTAMVTLDATISQLVVAGSYTTTLTYALVTP